MTTDESPEPYATLVETHTAVVFFLGDRAYKVKKPVAFEFLDFRRRDARECACRREVELNRRLAPDVYLGLAWLTGPSKELKEPLVAMRRLPTARRLATLVATGADVRDDLRLVAHRLAALHARAVSTPDVEAVASRDATAARWEANASEMARVVGATLDPVVGDRVISLAGRYLDGRAPLFAARIAGGRIVDGHGDLLAEDIFCLPDGPRVLDCIEFDDRLRWGDALADAAFLAMDLERLGRADLAAVFLDSYRQFAADSWPASLAHHYVAYRAQVRAKVACLRASQGTGASAEAANGLMALALRHLDAGRIRLVLVGGLPGAGKSTLAASLGDALEAAVLRSDELRKQEAGLDVTDRRPAPLGGGLYTPQATAAVYTELLARARTCLVHGLSVVLDASWQGPAWRRAAQAIASETAADLDELRCVAPGATRQARIHQRAALGADPSDATMAVARAMAASEVPWPTATVIDTTPAPEVVLEQALGRLRPDPVHRSQRRHENHGR
jgi:aminoglycoside phosphotransferase family enzyme/predicted kinase